ncbi:hypothetical protein CK203_105090 [Vitis vinifera]|uniref:Uncharacterized protein n=1 Tax=Vitis vinifera TaxID=29760 RepID=A0A438EJ37_VITVI|nr:hypothetical protein CK203_105090 [Vitis vinifera]
MIQEACDVDKIGTEHYSFVLGIMEPVDGVVTFNTWDLTRITVPHEDFLVLSLKIVRFQVCQTVEWWILYVEGVSRGISIGIIPVLQSPTRECLEQAIHLGFHASNNEAKYEALLIGGVSWPRKCKRNNGGCGSHADGGDFGAEGEGTQEAQMLRGHCGFLKRKATASQFLEVIISVHGSYLAEILRLYCLGVDNKGHTCLLLIGYEWLRITVEDDCFLDVLESRLGSSLIHSSFSILHHGWLTLLVMRNT